MKGKKLLTRVFLALYRYILFFLLVAFLATCTMTLFVGTLSQDLGITLTGENLERASKLTFLNVILLSVLFTTIDIIRRKLTTERITKRIAEATREMVSGNFGVRISKAGFITDGNYNEIIDCFNTAAEELGSLETLRTDFIADVSHEMKTPLAVLQNYGTLLQAKEISDEKRIEYAKCITDGTRKTADMITNILKLNKLENQRIYPKIGDFDLGEQLCECLLCFESTWESKEIELSTDIEDDIRVRADSELLSLVWNNLFSNSFKFTPDGGNVSVSLKTNGNYAVITVKDTGCGMSAEIGKHIFEKFYQGDSSRSTQGNGLGLALVKRVIDILQGEITVESAPEQGTAFTVRIRREAI